MMIHSLYTTYTIEQGTEGLPHDAHLGLLQEPGRVPTSLLGSQTTRMATENSRIPSSISQVPPTHGPIQQHKA